jgi:hypothetical protein
VMFSDFMSMDYGPQFNEMMSSNVIF